ncbi:lipopolysaccharide biosynthesis protein [Aeromonas veronii]|uniref:lipopolysaccharide biosynthesis protein n=1 Tax=Aeromonas veronii TaxID=654 RepID=UPI003F74A760
MEKYRKIGKLISVMLTRGGGALFALLSSVFIVRFLGNEHSGEYFTLIAYSLFMVTIITYGGNQSMLKQSKHNENSISVIYNHIKITVVLSIFISPAIIILTYVFFDISIFNLCMMSLCAFAYSLSQQLHHCCIAKEKQEISYLLHAWLPNFLLLTSIFFYNINVLYISYILGYLISFFIQGFVILAKDAAFNNVTTFERDLKSRCSFFQQDFIGQIFSSLVIVISSFFIPSADISKLTIYIKVASVCNILISVLNVSVYPVLTRELRMGNKSQALKTLRAHSVLGALFVLLYSVVIIAFWNYIKNWFNVDNLPMFLILPLLLSYVFVAFSSARQMVLNSFGYEKIVKNYSWVVFIFGMFLLTIGAKFYSIEGALIALSSIVLLQALFNLNYYKKSIK